MAGGGDSHCGPRSSSHRGREREREWEEEGNHRGLASRRQEVRTNARIGRWEASRDVGACRQSRKEEREANGKKGSSIEGNETLGVVKLEPGERRKERSCTEDFPAEGGRA